MNTIEIINGIVVLLGVPAVLAAFLQIGRRFQILDDLRTDMAKVKANLTVVCNYLIGLNADFPDHRLQVLSPAQLSPEGLDFLSNKQTKFMEAFHQNQLDFFKAIDSEQPKTKFDVERAAIRSVLSLWQKAYFEPVKIYLYNHPTEDPRKFSILAGVYIRDKYLARHPEITQ